MASLPMVCREDPGHRQWFYFALTGAQPGEPYRFNLVNMVKKDSLVNHGLSPLIGRGLAGEAPWRISTQRALSSSGPVTGVGRVLATSAGRLLLLLARANLRPSDPEALAPSMVPASRSLMPRRLVPGGADGKPAGQMVLWQLVAPGAQSVGLASWFWAQASRPQIVV